MTILDCGGRVDFPSLYTGLPTVQKILIADEWIDSDSNSSFVAANPATGQSLEESYPVSSWNDCDRALHAATDAFAQLRDIPRGQLASFITDYADRVDARADEICAAANQETGLPLSPRLRDVELPRTTNQLRLAGQAVRDTTWSQPTIDTATGIRSVLQAIGPVAVFGPNNFPLAFGSISGGDFAAAIAAGNPVIAKANSSHPATTRLFAEAALAASQSNNMPAGMVQLIYRTSHADGERLVADPRLAAIGYTGSRTAGLKLKRIADERGKPIYLELSSINPVIILPAAIEERGSEIATELAGSCLLGAGQFCTSPGLLVCIGEQESQDFVNVFIEQVKNAACGTLLSQSVQASLQQSVQSLEDAGAKLLCGGTVADGPPIRYSNTVLQVSGEQFLQAPAAFQTEAFGNASLVVTAADVEQACEIVGQLEGNLTGCVFSHSGDADETTYQKIEPALRLKVGRLLNDKMPTGVAVSPAMNHGGPFPATGHPGFSAVGMPQSIHRFSMLQCYDNVREHRLPSILRANNPDNVSRNVDGVWTDKAV